MQDTIALATRVDSSSGAATDTLRGDSMPDNTPKRTSAIVQPMPRRLLPAHQPVPPPSLSTDDIARDLSGSGGFGRKVKIENVSITDEIKNSPESSPNDHTSALYPTHPAPLMDMSARRSSAFSVSDLLGRKDPTKAETKLLQSVYHQPVYPTMMAPMSYPTFPQAYMLPPRMDMNSEPEYPKFPIKEDTSPTGKPQLRNPSPIGPSRSLTSSPESPKSDTSVSDRSDPNSSTDPDISPNFYKSAMDKKSNRTNYTPMQVRRLEKVFLENPYPEHEMYEQLSKDLSIPEQRLKVWFQNKRARWKRRAEDKMTQPSPYPFPMMPMGYPYAMMPGTMTSPPESQNHVFPKSMFPYGTAPAGLMMYPGSCYPHPHALYPYLPHQMHVQQ